MKTVNIVDYRIKSPTLAKVVIAYTGDIDRDYIKATLTEKLEYLATPVANSFKQIKPGMAVGFIRANKAVRAVSPNEVSAKYREMSSNILMDKADSSLWEVKDGAAGKYLARHGQEDLTALVEASIQRRPDAVRLNHITIAKAAPQELVAFVADDGDVDHGFAIAGNDSQVKVLSFSRRIPVTVDYDSVVSIYPVNIPKDLHKQVVASLTNEEKKQSRDYYTRLYSYDPAYLALVIDQVNNPTVA
jgi:hypothetical protein